MSGPVKREQLTKFQLTRPSLHVTYSPGPIWSINCVHCNIIASPLKDFSTGAMYFRAGISIMLGTQEARDALYVTDRHLGRDGVKIW